MSDKKTNESGNPKASLVNKLKGLKAKGVNTGESPVKTEWMEFPQFRLPVLSPASSSADLGPWIEKNKPEVDELLRSQGAVLFRGFTVGGNESFRHFLDAWKEHVIEYKMRSSPRHEIKDRIYTSTDHPNDQEIKMHNEHSYAEQWPQKIAFFCEQEAEQGGETPIADSRKIISMLRPETQQQFRDKGVLYIRNLGTSLGLSWQEVFQSEDRAVVENYCRENGVEHTWNSNQHLQLRFVKPAIRKHPHTGEETWFNHAYFFNIQSLDANLRRAIAAADAEKEFPFATRFGDGSSIPQEIIDEIGQAFEKLKTVFPWKRDDILVLDNMLTSHGRNSFTGSRKILVGMMNPIRG